MKIAFYQADKAAENLLAMAFCHGARVHGDACVRHFTADYRGPDHDADLAVVFGVKGASRRIMDDHAEVGRKTVYVDKGYLQRPAPASNRLSRAFLYKVSLGFQPLEYLEPMPDDRWRMIEPHWGPEVEPWRLDGDHVVWLGPSQKYCTFHGLGDATEYSRKIIERIRLHTSRPVVYRPKHSWADAEPVPGARFSQSKKVEYDLAGAWAAVTHGSNTSVLAVVHGIPVVALGPAITRPIASTELGVLPVIGCPTEEARTRWLHRICYWQWSIAEIHDGHAWDHVRRYL